MGTVLALAFGLGACSKTSMSLSRDAGVEVPPSVEPAADTGPAGGLPDTAPVVADSAVGVPDVLATDSAVGGDASAPDSAVMIRDAVGPDTADGSADATVASDGAIAMLDGPAPLGDAAPVGFDSAVVLPDSARPSADSAETASDPFANRTFRIDTEHPAPTPDSSCTQYRAADYVEMTFSADLTTLKVLDVRGSAASHFEATAGPEANKLTYHVTDFMGGGRITFERDQGVYVAQLVLYGSGVPVVQCLRGTMSPQP